MFYVYLLQSIKNQKFYIGFSKDLESRIKYHQEGKSRYTKENIPYKLIYYEAYSSERDARKREIALKKQGRQKAFLLKNLENSKLN